MSKMTLTTEGDTHVIVTRHFAAPPDALYRAHTDPKIRIQKWMLGPEGWTMPVCISDARPGGKIRYEKLDQRQRRRLPPHRRISYILLILKIFIINTSHSYFII